MSGLGCQLLSSPTHNTSNNPLLKSKYVRRVRFTVDTTLKLNLDLLQQLEVVPSR